MFPLFKLINGINKLLKLLDIMHHQERSGMIIMKEIDMKVETENGN